HRCLRARKGGFGRAQQGRPAFRDRRGACDPGAGRPEREGRRHSDRARSDRERRRARSSAKRSPGRTPECRADARGACERGQGHRRTRSAAGSRSRAGRHPAAAPAKPGERASRQDRRALAPGGAEARSEEHTSELQSLAYLVCRLLLEKKKKYILFLFFVKKKKKKNKKYK